MIDERSGFPYDEVVAALSRVMRPTEAKALAHSLTSQPPENVGSVQWSESILQLLSLVSESCASRVQEILGLSTREMTEFVAKARERYAR
jgi:hypothetical protein